MPWEVFAREVKRVSAELPLQLWHCVAQQVFKDDTSSNSARAAS